MELYNEKDLKQNQMVDVWYLGPKRPVSPDPPVEPKKTGRAVDDALAMQQYEDALSDYKRDLALYAKAKREFDEHRANVGGPIRLERWATDANEWIQIHSDEYVKHLPAGMKPGRAHEEAVEMAAKRDEERLRIKERDPHMGKQQGAAA